jgi:hypothetical protein
MIWNKLCQKRGYNTRITQTRRGDEKAQVIEEQNIVIIDYTTNHPSPKKNSNVQSSREWHNLQEGLRYQVEVERQKAIAHGYNAMLPPR